VTNFHVVIHQLPILSLEQLTGSLFPTAKQDGKQIRGFRVTDFWFTCCDGEASVGRQRRFWFAR